MFDSGECATNTPFCSIRSSSASPEWTQCAMIQGAAAKEAELVMASPWELLLGTELANPVDLAVVLGQMALHRQIVFLAQARKTNDQIVRAGRDEARREDWLRGWKAVFGIENPALGVAQGMVG